MQIDILDIKSIIKFINTYYGYLRLNIAVDDLLVKSILNIMHSVYIKWATRKIHLSV